MLTHLLSSKIRPSATGDKATVQGRQPRHPFAWPLCLKMTGLKMTVITTLLSVGGIAVMSGSRASIAIAQTSHFGDLAVGTGQLAGKLRGTTGGTTSLPAIVSSRDRHNNQCLGYADTKPDHLLILKENLPALTLQLKSGKVDTTLVVQGPDGVVRCGDDTGPQKAASITDSDWKEGVYKVWVGTATPGEQVDYVLTVQP